MAGCLRLDISDCLQLTTETLRPELAANDASLKEFELEISLLSNIRHYGVVRMLGAGSTSDANRFVVLEVCSKEEGSERASEQGK